MTKALLQTGTKWKSDLPSVVRLTQTPKHTGVGGKQFFFLLVLFLGGMPFSTCGQEDLSWKVLSDVSFEEKYDESIDAYWLVPNFGEKPKAFQNKEVILKGYFIPLTADGSMSVLSRYPYSACFFCGGAGPESIVEIQLMEKPDRSVRMDARLQVQGKLVLNRTDIEHFNYILQEAKIIEE